MPRHRSHGEGTIYPDKKHPGRFIAQILHPSGKRLGHRGTQAECRAWLLEQRKSIKDNNYVTDETITMADLIERYFRDVAPLTLQPRTASIHLYATKKNILPELGNIKVSKLRAAQLQTFYSKKLKEGLSERYVLNLHNRVYTFLQVAKKWGMVSRNVAEDAIPPRPKDKKVTVLTVEQAHIFLDGVREDRLYPLYACAIVMGLRQGELLALEWSDVDFINRRLNVNKSQQYITGKGISTKTPKTETSVRDLPMPDLAYEALIEHRQKTMGMGRLFTTTKGTPFSARNLLKYFQRELKKLGLPKIPFHNLRHSCASYHLAAGTSPKFVQELLGHTTVAFTLRKYSHLLPGVAEEAVDKLNRAFAKKSVKQGQ
jgi:integrase